LKADFPSQPEVLPLATKQDLGAAVDRPFDLDIGAVFIAIDRSAATWPRSLPMARRSGKPCGITGRGKGIRGGSSKPVAPP